MMLKSRLFNPSIQSRIWHFAILASATLVALALVLAWTLQRASDANSWIAHSQEVRKALDAYSRELIDAETGQRGYLLTQQDAYLLPFQHVLDNNQGRLGQLSELLEGSPAHARLARLAQVFELKLTELSETIQLTRAGKLDAALALVREGLGQRYTVEFQRLIQEIADIESALLASRQQAADAEAHNVFAIVAIGGVLALLLILLAARRTAAQIGRPLNELIRGIEAIADGDLERRVVPGAGDELGQLALAFNAMADRLAVSNQAREHGAAELRRHHDHLEERVALATSEVNAIVRTAVSGIVTISAGGIIQVYNPAAEKLFGWSRHEVLGKNVSMLMEDAFASRHDGYLAQFSKDRQSKVIGFEREVKALRKDGSVFPAHLAVGHAQVSENNHFFVAFISDISEQKKIQDSLKRAKEAAEMGARSKTTFIANMSHEIRTPMNAIIGFTEVLLQDAQLSQRSAEHVHIVLRSAKALMGIINDILDISKLESGKFSLERVAFHLPNALADALRLVDHQATDKGLTVTLEYHADLPLRVTGDPTRLRQIMLNLVGNAIKFTETGSIRIAVHASQQQDMLKFSVSDTGIGMTAEQIDKVFEPFTQADASTTRRFGGTGLGTVISKQIAEQMGGEIWIDSSYGEGSTFHFTACLPQASVLEGCLFEEGSAIAAGYVSPRIFHILLAEDILANATLAMLRLRQQGHRVDSCENGREAVAAFEAGHFDLILMDVMMPEMDGLEATRAIRTIEKTRGGRVPILALTASVMREDYDKCVAAGMDGVQAKPIEFSELFAAMERVVAPDGGQANTVHRLDLGAAAAVNFSALDGIVDHHKALRVWHDPLVYAKALASFAAERFRDADQMERLLMASPGNVEPARAVAHALKGVAGNLCIGRVTAQASKIDASLKSGQRNAGIAQLAQLRWLLAEAVNAIGKVMLLEGEAAATIVFDSAAAAELLDALAAALAQLNPDAVEPILARLAEYLPKGDLAPIQRAVDAFDFDSGMVRTAALAETLGLGRN